MIIDGIVLDDEVEYKCVVKNFFGLIECIVEFLVDEIVIKFEFLKELSLVEVLEGCNV